MNTNSNFYLSERLSGERKQRVDVIMDLVCLCVLSQFDLVCSDGWLVDMYQATLNVGFLVGSIAIGYLADR